ncbi:hypothetical protein RF11_12266 [Thelohanellus kitauei]|uniref:Uncharacterized protein n=1 Tax=Thelohanellus kitauei TaxID=669202 RepID=A0A0C2J4H2_THEKT|nr:hypothetical protein RF11_12266 [Thelohanellus kitauei]
MGLMDRSLTGRLCKSEEGLNIKMTDAVTRLKTNYDNRTLRGLYDLLTTELEALGTLMVHEITIAREIEENPLMAKDMNGYLLIGTQYELSARGGDGITLFIYEKVEISGNRIASFLIVFFENQTVPKFICLIAAFTRRLSTVMTVIKKTLLKLGINSKKAFGGFPWVLMKQSIFRHLRRPFTNLDLDCKYNWILSNTNPCVGGSYAQPFLSSSEPAFLREMVGLRRKPTEVSDNDFPSSQPYFSDLEFPVVNYRGPESIQSKGQLRASNTIRSNKQCPSVPAWVHFFNVTSLEQDNLQGVFFFPECLNGLGIFELTWTQLKMQEGTMTLMQLESASLDDGRVDTLMMLYAHVGCPEAINHVISTYSKHFQNRRDIVVADQANKENGCGCYTRFGDTWDSEPETSDVYNTVQEYMTNIEICGCFRGSARFSRILAIDMVNRHLS